MDRRQIHDAQLIERYLAGRLSPAEEQSLEEAYLADPALLEEIQLAERMRSGFKDLATESAPRPARAAGWRSIAASPRYGLAASFVAAVAFAAAGGLYLQNMELKSAGAGQSGASAARVLDLVTVRGAGGTNAVTAPAANEWTVLRLDTAFADYDVFSAALLRAGTVDELVHVDGLAASDGLVSFGLPGSALPVGSYEIRLAGGKRDWPTSRALDELSRTSLLVTPRP
jgi:hypothetical protein